MCFLPVVDRNVSLRSKIVILTGKDSHTPAFLPFFRVCDLEHRLAGFVHQVERIKCVEIDPPATLLMLDSNIVVTENHLRWRNAQVLGHFLDRVRLEDGQLLCRDAEAMDGDLLGPLRLRRDGRMARRRRDWGGIHVVMERALSRGSRADSDSPADPEKEPVRCGCPG